MRMIFASNELLTGTVLSTHAVHNKLPEESDSAECCANNCCRTKEEVSWAWRCWGRTWETCRYTEPVIAGIFRASSSMRADSLQWAKPGS